MERKSYKSQKFIIIKPHLVYCFSIFLFSACALLTAITITATCPQEAKRSLSSKADTFWLAESDGKRENEGKMGSTAAEMGMFGARLPRRYLGGPGSSPPRCTSKCGNCTPCKPVHVPVPPGTPVTAEYYPEAWRCKCGNKLYMP